MIETQTENRNKNCWCGKPIYERMLCKEHFEREFGEQGGKEE